MEYAKFAQIQFTLKMKTILHPDFQKINFLFIPVLVFQWRNIWFPREIDVFLHITKLFSDVN